MSKIEKNDIIKFCAGAFLAIFVVACIGSFDNQTNPVNNDSVNIPNSSNPDRVNDVNSGIESSSGDVQEDPVKNTSGPVPEKFIPDESNPRDSSGNIAPPEDHKSKEG